MVNFIFDTDMGNDIDDAFAQAMIANAHAKKEANLALTVSSNPNPASVAMIKAINKYYGAGNSPVAIHKGALKYANDSEGFCKTTAKSCGIEVEAEGIEEAVAALRKALNALPDNSVRVVATGFATNLAALMDSPDGMGLIKRKVQFLSVMAADFHHSHKRPDGSDRAEFNVEGDIPAMRKLMDSWPTSVIISDFSIGLPVCVDWQRMDRQLKDSNPVKTGYVTFYKGTPGSRPSWDQTSMLYALEPESGHFALSDEGRVEILESGISLFHPQKGSDRRFLLFDKERTKETVNESLHSRFYIEP